MNKALVFDMDGTIANLYGVNGWLDDIIARDTRPYDEALPLVDIDMFNSLLNILKDFGWKVAVTSWLAKNSTDDYDIRVENSKREWLRKYNIPCDIINVVAYGTEKSTVTKNLGGYQVLFDDEVQNRNNWRNGYAIDPKNIISDLIDLVVKETEKM